ncbi:nicotinate-nucleotide diphosphorylase (carboxylating) [Hypoxylon texense]
MAAFRFNATPLNTQGVRFRDLCDYGNVEHESGDKLVIEIFHRDPLSLLRVVKEAWVTKYLAPGTPCAIRFGPLVQYAKVEITVERIGAPNTIDSDMAQQLRQLTSSLALAAANPLLYTIPEEDEGESSAPDKGKGVGHPRMNYDYLAENRGSRRGGMDTRVAKGEEEEEEEDVGRRERRKISFKDDAVNTLLKAINREARRSEEDIDKEAIPLQLFKMPGFSLYA